MAELDRDKILRRRLDMPIDKIGRCRNPALHGCVQSSDQGSLARGTPAMSRERGLGVGQSRARRAEELLAGQNDGGQPLQGVRRGEAGICRQRLLQGTSCRRAVRGNAQDGVLEGREGVAVRAGMPAAKPIRQHAISPLLHVDAARALCPRD
jgi:hypothetical protein